MTIDDLQGPELQAGADTGPADAKPRFGFEQGTMPGALDMTPIGSDELIQCLCERQSRMRATIDVAVERVVAPHHKAVETRRSCDEHNASARSISDRCHRAKVNARGCVQSAREVLHPADVFRSGWAANVQR